MTHFWGLATGQAQGRKPLENTNSIPSLQSGARQEIVTHLLAEKTGTHKQAIRVTENK